MNTVTNNSMPGAHAGAPTPPTGSGGPRSSTHFWAGILTSLPVLALLVEAVFDIGSSGVRLGIGVAALVATLAAHLIVHRTYIAPLRQLALASGEFSQRIIDRDLPENGAAELRTTVSSINALLRHLRDLRDQASIVASGDFTRAAAPLNDRDSLGHAFYEMTNSLKQVAAVCQRVAVGDYGSSLEVRGEHDLLGRSVNQMISNLREVVTQIETAGAQVASASREQADGARNQSVATEEMYSTVTELLASAKQISESASSVAEESDKAARECEAGSQAVVASVEGIRGIRERVERIAEHMVDLGSKSQQILGVLDIINELSEQTHLLSLNASIEAAGAGEAGKRFAVVASEIRKLAERATGSTNEIQGLIDSVQETVNATTMATEEGTKAAIEGVVLTEESASAFERIAALVERTASSAKSIELGSRQQVHAIEQMEAAVRDVDTAAQQTAQTATQLDEGARSLLGTAQRLTAAREELQPA